MSESCQTGTVVQHTVGGNDQLVGGSIIEERLLVEELVVGLGVVGERDLDLAVLGVRENDRQGSVPLEKVDCCRADSGCQEGEARQRVLHVGEYGASESV